VWSALSREFFLHSTVYALHINVRGAPRGARALCGGVCARARAPGAGPARDRGTAPRAGPPCAAAAGRRPSRPRDRVTVSRFPHSTHPVCVHQISVCTASRKRSRPGSLCSSAGPILHSSTTTQQMAWHRRSGEEQSRRLLERAERGVRRLHHSRGAQECGGEARCHLLTGDSGTYCSHAVSMFFCSSHAH